MRPSILNPALWLTHLILLLLSICVLPLLSSYFYPAYSLNEFFKVEFFNIEVEDSLDSWFMNIQITLSIITNLVAIYVFWIVRKMLLAMKDIGPFEIQTVGYLRSISLGVMAVVVLRLATIFAHNLYLGKIWISIGASSLIIMFLIAIIFLLIEIFKFGISIREDQKLTI